MECIWIFERITVNTVLVCISVILILIALFQKNSNFFDIRFIIKSHFKVFSASPFQCAVIFGVPILLAIAAVNKQVLTKDMVDTLIIILSILLSMLFAMLSILSSLKKKAASKEQENDATASKKIEKYNELLKETFNSVIFEGILCIIILATLLTLLFASDFTPSSLLTVISWTVYYLSLEVVLNILVVIKRLSTLFNNA